MKTTAKETLVATGLAAVLAACTFAVAAVATPPLGERLIDARPSYTEALEPGLVAQRYDVEGGMIATFAPSNAPQGEKLPLVLLTQSSSFDLGYGAELAKEGRVVVAYNVPGMDVADAISFAKAHLPVDDTKVFAP